MISLLLVLLACFHGLTFSAPTSSNPGSLRTEEVVAEYDDVDGAPPLVGDLFPIDVYKGLKYSGFELGNSPVGIQDLNLFSIEFDAPFPVARYLVDDIKQTPPSITSSYPGSNVRYFDLHELAFHCITTTTTVPGLLLKCTLEFTPYMGTKRLQPQIATFTPVPGSELPLVLNKKSKQQVVKFGSQFKKITAMDITVRSTVLTAVGINLGLPSAAMMIGTDNLKYKLCYED
ncbi:hypothetical protein TWF281_010744 [Arthrobotrys megalospora]